MAAYLIAEQIIKDAAKFERYKNAVAPIIARFGGTYLTKGETRILAGNVWKPERTIIITFSDMAALNGWWDSPDYQPLKTLRDEAATVMALALDGA
ncbi:MAG: DUF1330 domain-containing protein [Alphaproteobacteria bacterium]